jgi:hypothetical protein
MFYIRRNRIDVNIPRNSGIVFDCTLQNRVNRISTVIVQEYELWLAGEANSGHAEFITRLSFDLVNPPTKLEAFRPQETRI